MAEWKRGWPLVLACFAGFSYFSLMTASLGVFITPLTREFGWSRTLASAGVTIASVWIALLSPFVGILIDRWGPRRLALPGLVAAGFTISAFALADGTPWQWLALWTVYAVVSISVKTTVWTSAVVGAFERSQGLAIGAVLSGTAAAQIITPPLATWLIAEYGWRLAYVSLGCGWGLVTFVLCHLFLRPSVIAHAADRTAASLVPFGLTLLEAKRDQALRRVGICAFIIMLFTIGLQIHQIPILVGAGVSQTDAAWLASLAGGAALVGKFISGLLLDRYRANVVGGLTFGATAIPFLLLLEGMQSPSLIVVAMLINGYAAGSKLQIASYLTSRYAGRRHFGVIYGVIISLVTIGSGFGPIVAGITFDKTSSYSPFLVAGAIGCVFCAFITASLPRYPTWEGTSNSPQ